MDFPPLCTGCDAVLWLIFNPFAWPAVGTCYRFILWLFPRPAAGSFTSKLMDFIEFPIILASHPEKRYPLVFFRFCFWKTHRVKSFWRENKPIEKPFKKTLSFGAKPWTKKEIGHEGPSWSFEKIRIFTWYSLPNHACWDTQMWHVADFYQPVFRGWKRVKRRKRIWLWTRFEGRVGCLFYV